LFNFYGAKIALALLLRAIFFKNHSRRVYLYGMGISAFLERALSKKKEPLARLLPEAVS
jgi:hypothetical protein